MRRSFFVHLLLSLGLLLPAWASAQADGDDAAATQQREEAASHEAARSARLAFSPCAENAALECGTLQVPLDYRRPHGEKVGLAVIRAKALDPVQRIGVLFTHNGGHASGVDFVLNVAQAPAALRVRQRFDIVSLDPRGAGRSRAFKCAGDFAPQPTDTSDASLIAHFDDLSQRAAQQCTSPDREFILSISGNNFARDMELLRRALGQPQWSLLMISNSGPVASIYASLFGQHVRAMVIDSPVGPNFSEHAMERIAEQSASYATVFAHLDRLCRRDAACRLQKVGVVGAFDKLAAQLAAAPIATPNGGHFGVDELSRAFEVLLPSEPAWPLAVAALADALFGDFSTLMGLAGAINRPSRSDAILARLCNDYGTRGAAAGYVPITEAIDAAYPRFFQRFAIGERVATCAQWPAADPPIIRDVRRKLAVPALLIGSELDSDAPFPWTKRLADAMGMPSSSVVRYLGGGHGLASRNNLTCMVGVIDNYLFALQLPAKDTQCAAQPIAFDAASMQAARQDRAATAVVESASVRSLR
jgi:pimeloyl-ACP methyl ester carboxylesterase